MATRGDFFMAMDNRTPVSQNAHNIGIFLAPRSLEASP